MKKIGSFLLAVAFAMASPVRQMSGWVQLLVLTAVIAAFVLPNPRTYTSGRVTTAGINKEAWEDHIEENLFPDNDFMSGMMDESEFVNYLTVHTPNAGNVPTIVVDPAFPLNGGNGLAVGQRTDTTVDWNIHVFTGSEPFVITNAEEVQLSYDKMSSVLYDFEMVLQETVADWSIINIAPTGTATLPSNILGGATNNNILRSSGITNNDLEDVRKTAAYTLGATGNRLNFTLYDLRQAKKLADKQRWGKKDRHMLMSADAADQIVNDLIITKYRQDANNVYDSATGDIDRLMGFKIWVRSNTCVYNNVELPVVKAYGAATATDDNEAIIFWQKGCVAKASGDIKIYEQLDSPKDLGDVYNALVRAGASKKRSSELGVGAIVQTAAI